MSEGKPGNRLAVAAQASLRSQTEAQPTAEEVAEPVPLEVGTEGQPAKLDWPTDFDWQSNVWEDLTLGGQLR